MSSHPPVKIGLLGLGTVGGGVTHVLARNAEEISCRAGREILISTPPPASGQHHRPHRRHQTDRRGAEVVNDPDISIIVELLGGYEPARSPGAAGAGQRQACGHRQQGVDRQARQRNLRRRPGRRHDGRLRGGGVPAVSPIIKAIREGLAGNRLEWVAGIINGTANFILTEMRDKGRDFPDVLAEAQALGYAEADPTFDVEGIDAAHKPTILA